MLEVKDMAQGEMLALLLRVGYGHLGCTRDDLPYVVPMNFAFDSQCLYFFTTEGTKTELIAPNRQVCFHVEEVIDPPPYRHRMLTGVAARDPTPEETDAAERPLPERNPPLPPRMH